ncbi:MAG: PKD domain-containing protein [Solirubrobacteraceae bacterium]
MSTSHHWAWAGARAGVHGFAGLILIAGVLMTTSAAAQAADRFAYITTDGQAVAPLDTVTNVAGTPIGVEDCPKAIAVTPDGQTAFAGNTCSDSVTPIDTATNTAGASISVGSNPSAIAIAPDGKTAYVVTQSDVEAIDTTADTVTATIAFNGGGGIAITPDGKTAYVVRPDADDAVPIDLTTNTVRPYINVGSYPNEIALAPDGKTAYVTDYFSDDVTPIDIATDTAETAIPAGAAPWGVAIVPAQPPTAEFTAPPATIEHDTSFDGAASSDFDGTITEYHWDFGDGSTDTTSSVTVTHRYSTEGEYRVTLRVVDNDGCSTAQIFTGQTMSCNGLPTAEIEHEVLIANERGAPVTAKPPTITGDGRVGAQLDCRHGQWADHPTGVRDQWSRDGAAIPGATAPTFTVQPSDEGHSLTCITTAENAHGDASSISSAVDVAIASRALCPAPSGALSGHRLGPVALGEARNTVRARLPSYNLKALYTDDLCLSTGPGIRVGYGSVTTLGPRAARSRLMGRVLLALTANRFYALDGVRPGERTASVRRRLGLGLPLHVGVNDWYVTHLRTGSGLLKVRHGVIIEVGIVNSQLTAGSTSARQLLKNF